jgi:preprotein translocase subunit SecG
MTTLHTLILVVHVLIGVMIVALVLIQRGKGADAGAAFGAGASGTVFGARGSANFLSRSTAVLALLFFGTSLGLAYLGTQRKAPESLLDVAEAVQPPAQPSSPVLDTSTSADLPALPADTVPAKPPMGPID